MPALLFVAALSAACPAGKQEGKYKNREAGFSLNFPEDWEVKEKQLGFDVVALSPPQGPSDEFRENVSVSSAAMARPYEPDEILDERIPELTKVVTDFKPLKRDYLQAGDGKAACLAYSLRQGRFRLVTRLCAVAGETRAYLIQATAEQDQLPDFEPQFDEILKSFRALK